jgi:hypothetical protein
MNDNLENKISNTKGYKASINEEYVQPTEQILQKKKPHWIKKTAMITTLALSIFGNTITKPIIHTINDYAFNKNPPVIMQTMEKAKFGMAACSSPVTPPPPPPNKVKVYATATAKNCFTGLPVTGQATYQPPTGSAVTKNLGEQAYLGEINPNTTMNVDISINVAGYLKRVFNDVALSGTKTFDTTLLDLNGFNLDGYTLYFLNDLGDASMGWINGTWDQSKVTAYFNPDPLTGERLSTEFITATEAAINEIALYSKGAINSVSFIENGTKPGNTPAVPPDSEIWVFPDSTANGVHNISYPTGGNVVKSIKLYYNMSSSLPGDVRKEGMDAFIQGNQNVFLDDYLAKWFEFSLKWRPKGTAFSYKIYLDREEQTGFDGTVTVGATVLSQSLSDEPGDYITDSITTGGSGYSLPDYSAPRTTSRQDAAKAGAQNSRDKAVAEKGKIRN